MARAYNEIGEDIESLLQVVAKKIGKKWRWLGRELKIEESEIEGIDEDYNSVQEKAFQVLLKWKQYNGRVGATKEVLAQALLAMKQTTIAEEVLQFGVQLAHINFDRCDDPGHINGVEEDGKILQEQGKSNNNDFQNGLNQNFFNADEEIMPTFDPPAVNPLLQTTNDYKQQASERFEKELDALLKSCIDNIPNCDRAGLVQNLKTVNSVQTLNSLVAELPHEYGDESAKKEIEKSRRRRNKQTDQTQRFILNLMADSDTTYGGTPSQKKPRRPRSEILQRCTSEVSLQPRSDTFSPGSTPDKTSISSPLCTSRSSLLSRNESRTTSPIDKICEEETNDLTEEHDASVRCEDCGKCIRHIDEETTTPPPPSDSAREHQEPISFDDSPTSFIAEANTDADTRDGHQNSKL